MGQELQKRVLRTSKGLRVQVVEYGIPLMHLRGYGGMGLTMGGKYLKELRRGDSKRQRNRERTERS